eukprot:CAMPEP_0176429346 /NCGR_PEP_ID=MMETSP0127-20121128/13663_1 /TAXON_ID=938130 /ORGANISM="Platyophrya macrostoma, Strain WH" /LENGTH=399 /DNA_ID=CAMNT_0017811147 /DNA_START=339 /DNA_END=1538 /DNA_ORIENTATION=-
MKGYITSYAVNLMWIHFLLRHQHVEYVPPSSISPSLDDKEALTYLPMLPEETSRSSFTTSVAELITGFFRFYAFEFDWKREVISVSRGTSKVLKEDLQWIESREIMSLIFRERVWYRLCIEDPFEENLNLGRHVSPIKMNKFVCEFVNFWTACTLGTPKETMVDRSSSHAADVCTQCVHRCMIGRTSADVEEVMETLRTKCLGSLAAFEVENTASSVLSRAGYEVTSNKKIMIPAAIRNGLHIPAHAQAEIAIIDEELANDPYLGSAATSERIAMNLRHLYFHHLGLKRYFLKEKDSLKFMEHRNAIERALDEKLVTFNVAQVEEFLKRVGIDADPDMITIVLADKQLIRPASETRDKQRQTRGTCSGCSATAVSVWPTMDPASDDGFYCNTCWEQYEQ